MISKADTTTKINWMSGIKSTDEYIWARKKKKFTIGCIECNKGRNFYFSLPILGSIGIMYHAQRDLKVFYVLLPCFISWIGLKKLKRASI
jgi:hypothetical protein